MRGRSPTRWRAPPPECGWRSTTGTRSSGVGARRRSGRTSRSISAFTVRDSSGAVAPLEPYLGMAAHAVVIRDDGSVFIHLHPMGTVSSAAQQIFAARDRGDTTARGRLRAGALDGGGMGSPAGGGMAGIETVPQQAADSVLRRTAHTAQTASGAPGMSGVPEAPGAQGVRGMPGMPALPGVPALSGTLSFPYEFPRPGRYRIWVQVKPHGRVLTGTFDVDVT